MPGGHVVATLSLGLHMVAVSMWIGCLAVVVALLRTEPDLGPVMLQRFSLLALWCVIVVAETGLLNASLRAGSPSALVGTPYGALVLAKAVLLGWLVRMGWLQRGNVAAMGDATSRESSGALRHLAARELAIMGAAIAVSVALARIGPAPSGVTAGPFSPLPVVLLALATPLLLACSFPTARAGAWSLWVRSYPEVPAVVLLFMVVEVAGVGVLDALLGPEAGALAGSALLVAAGWSWAHGALGGRGIAPVVIVMAGWPLAAWLSSLLAGSSSGWRPSFVSLLLAEALLVAALLQVRSRSRAAAQSSVVVAG